MANTALDIEQFKMTSLAELDVRLGKLIKPGMTVLLTKDLSNHGVTLGTPMEILKINRPSRYANEVTYSARSLNGNNNAASLRKGEFKIVGIQRDTLVNLITQLDKEKAAFQGLLDTMNGYGMTKGTDYIDVRKELIKKVYAEVSAEGVDEATKVTRIVEMVDLLSF